MVDWKDGIAKARVYAIGRINKRNKTQQVC